MVGNQNNHSFHMISKAWFLNMLVESWWLGYGCAVLFLLPIAKVVLKWFAPSSCRDLRLTKRGKNTWKLGLIRTIWLYYAWSAWPCRVKYNFVKYLSRVRMLTVERCVALAILPTIPTNDSADSNITVDGLIWFLKISCAKCHIWCSFGMTK